MNTIFQVDQDILLILAGNLSVLRAFVANFCSKCVENVPYRAREEEHWQLVAITPEKHRLYGLKALESKIE